MKNNTLFLYLLKVWCTSIVIAPVLSTLLLQNHIHSSNQFMEIMMITGVTFMACMIYLLPALLITYLLAALVSKFIGIIRLKALVAALLTIFVSLQMAVIYKYNLSLVYKGAGTTALAYIAVFFVTVFIYKLTDLDQHKDLGI